MYLRAVVRAWRVSLGAVLGSHLPLLPGSRAMKVEPLLSRHCPQTELGVSNRDDWPFREDEMDLTRGAMESWDGRKSSPSEDIGHGQVSRVGSWERPQEWPGGPKGPVVLARPGHISISTSQWAPAGSGLSEATYPPAHSHLVLPEHHQVGPPALTQLLQAGCSWWVCSGLPDSPTRSAG